jgi:hypothetical protein
MIAWKKRVASSDPSGDNVDGTTNIIPAMNRKTLQAGYRQILDYIYSPAPYYQRIKTFLREYKPPRIRNRLQLCHLLAFVRSFLPDRYCR